MAEFTLENVKENAEFLEYIKQEFGYEKFDDIPPFGQESVLNAFRYNKNDLANDEFESLLKQEENEDVLKLKDLYFPGKKFADLSADKHVFLNQLSKKIEKDENLSYEDIENYIHRHDNIEETFAQMVGEYSETNDPQTIADFFAQKREITKGASKDEREQINKQIEDLLAQEEILYGGTSYLVTDDFRKAFNKANDEENKKYENLASLVDGVKTHGENSANKQDDDKTVIAEQEEKDDRKDNTDVKTIITEQEERTNDEQDKEEYEEIDRIRSLSSDENEFVRDVLKLQVLKDMQIISEDDYLNASKEVDLAIAEINKHELNDQQKEEFDVKIREAYLSDRPLKEVLPQETFDFIKQAHNNANLDEISVFNQQPPMILTNLYRGAKDDLSKAQDDENADKTKLQANLDKIGQRIDKLTDEYNSGLADTIAFQQYNYDDNTNIADVYDGYVGMFEERKPDVEQDQKDKIDNCKKKLDKDLDQYLAVWNLDELKKNHDGASNLDTLSDNLQKLDKQMANVTLSQETLQMLRDKVEFKDDKGNIEPQISEKDGQLSIIPGSRLEALVDLSKAKTRIANFAKEQKVSDQELQTELQDRLMVDLYATDTVEKSLQGIAEKKDNFNDPQNLEQFKQSLLNPERKLTISDAGYNIAKRNSVNDINACINRTSKIIGNSNPNLQSLHAPIAKYDARSADRFKADGKYNVSFWKTTGLTALSSVAMKGVNYAAYKGLTYAGLGISYAATAGIAATGLAGLGMWKNYSNYKKAAKAKGEKPSFKKFITPSANNPYAMMNIGSALGFTAGACLLAGQPHLAAVAGAASLGVMGYSTYKEARKHGLSKKKASLQVLKRVGGMITGAGIGAGISSLFGNDPNNVKVIEEGKAAVEGREAIPGTDDSYKYVNGTEENALNKMQQWNNQEFIDKLHSSFNSPENQQVLGKDMLSSDRAGLIAHYLGLDATKEVNIYGQGMTTDHQCFSSYEAFRAGFENAPIGDGVGEIPQETFNQLNRITPEIYQDMQNAISSDGTVNLNENAKIGIQILDRYVVGPKGEINLPGYNGLAVDYAHIPENASVNALGEHVYDANGDEYSTWIKGGQTVEFVPGQEGQPAVPATPAISPDTEQLPNYAVGYWEPVKDFTKKLKNRIGSFADKLLGKKKKNEQEPTDVAIVTPPQKKGNNKEEKEKEPTDVTIVTPPQKKKVKKREYIKPTIEVRYNKLLLDEYKIVYGVKPNTNEGSNDKWKKYCERVEAERKVDAPDSTLNEFLLARRKKLDDIVMKLMPDDTTKSGANVDNGDTYKTDYQKHIESDNRGTSKFINETRQSLWQSNLSKENYNDRMTLSHFSKYAEAFGKKNSIVADGSRDIRQNPVLKRSYREGDANVVITDLNVYLFSKNPNDGIDRDVKGRDAIKKMKDISIAINRNGNSNG